MIISCRLQASWKQEAFSCLCHYVFIPGAWHCTYLLITMYWIDDLLHSLFILVITSKKWNQEYFCYIITSGSQKAKSIKHTQTHTYAWGISDFSWPFPLAGNRHCVALFLFAPTMLSVPTKGKASTACWEFNSYTIVFVLTSEANLSFYSHLSHGLGTVGREWRRKHEGSMQRSKRRVSDSEGRVCNAGCGMCKEQIRPRDSD